MDNSARKSGANPANAGSKWIRPNKRLAIYLRDGLACVYCGIAVEDADCGALTLDHVTPSSKGGDNENTNLVTACRRCNCARQDRSVRAFAEAVAHYLMGNPDDVIRRVRNATNRQIHREEANRIIARRQAA